MKNSVSPMVIIIAAVVIAAGVGLLIWRTVAAPSPQNELIVKPANPNDPKYRPDPKLGLAGGGGG